MDSLNLLLEGFANALTPMNLLYACIGVLLGTAVGVLPGIGPAMTVALWIAAVALIVIGVAGTILPAIPGVTLVFLGMLLAAWIDDFARIPVWLVVVFALLTALTWVVDYLAAAAGAKRAGASRLAVIGALIGTVAGIFTGFVGLLFMPLVGAAIAGIMMWIFTTLMGGNATFTQVFAVMNHAGVVSMLSPLLAAAMIAGGVKPNGIRPPGANLGVFVPMLEETSFVAVMLSSIDLVLVWWLVSLAIGLGVLYKRRTGPIATTFLGLYALIALLIAFVRSGS